MISKDPYVASCLWLLVAAFSVTSAGFGQPLVEGEVKAVDITVNAFDPPNVDSVVAATHPVGRTGASFVRLHFDRIQDRSNVRYRIVISDDKGTPLAELARDEFGTREQLWTGVLPSDRVIVKVVAESRPEGLSFRISQVVIQKRGRVLLSIKKPDDSEQLLETHDENLIAAAAAVAKLAYVEGSEAKSCTGFLLDSRHLLTNEHCVATRETCETAVAIFGFVRRLDRTVSPGVGYRCLRVVKADWRLDAAILELDRPPGLDQPTGLELEPRPLQTREPLVLVHHAAGEPLKVTRRHCRVEAPVLPGRSTPTDLGHFCDCSSGSSGGALLSARSNRVVGLHHWGFEDGVKDTKNQAVRMQELKAFIAVALQPPDSETGD